VTALFGRSGSGKSSVLNAIAGLIAPERGRIALGETVFFDSSKGVFLPVQQRRIGYVFQEGRLLPHLSVRQNLLYGRFFTPRDELGLPIVYVSHSIDEVVRIADNVVVLAEGKVTESHPVAGSLEGGTVIDTRVAEHDLAWGLTRLEFGGGMLYASDVDALVGE